MYGTRSLWPLLSEVLDAVQVPVLAAGGIGDGRGMAAALAAGAAGVRMGTRFIATPESDAREAYKAAIVAAGPGATVLNEAYSVQWPDEVVTARVLRSAYERSLALPEDAMVGRADRICRARRRARGPDRGPGRGAPPERHTAPIGWAAVAAHRTILHVDMDAFYASVEQLRNPELRGKPVIVGGKGARGVVAAASYEARVYGVHSAMSSTRAQRLCPHAIFLGGDHDHYAEVSKRVMAIFGSVSPLVEALSLDEAFLDVTGARRLLGDGAAIAALVRERVLEHEGLTCSVGVATSKHVAKLASEAAKPRIGKHGPEPGLGVKVVPPGEELAFLHPLPVQALWGVGPKTLERLRGRGITTVGDLAHLEDREVQDVIGSANGTHLWRLANGIDERAVVPEQRAKSIGHEETFARDHHYLDTLHHELVRLGDSVASRLRGAGVAGRTVSIKVRFGDFTTITRSVTLATAVDTGPDVIRAASQLLERIDPTPGVRLLGVHVSQLLDHADRQLSLDDVLEGGDQQLAWAEATTAVDAIRARFGADAVVPATLAGPEGIRVKRRGDQQWGPTDMSGPQTPAS